MSSTDTGPGAPKLSTDAPGSAKRTKYLFQIDTKPKPNLQARLRTTTKSVPGSNHCKDESKRASEDANDETFELTIAVEFTNRESKDSGTMTAFKDMKRRSWEQRAKCNALLGTPMSKSPKDIEGTPRPEPTNEIVISRKTLSSILEDPVALHQKTSYVRFSQLETRSKSRQ